MAKVIWTERASVWLQDIHDYISQDNPTAADRTVTAIQNKASLLARFPELGSKFEGNHGRNIRVLLYGHYRIAYIIGDDEIIGIIGVFHAALDIEQYLF